MDLSVQQLLFERSVIWDIVATTMFADILFLVFYFTDHPGRYKSFATCIGIILVCGFALAYVRISYENKLVQARKELNYKVYIEDNEIDPNYIDLSNKYYHLEFDDENHKAILCSEYGKRSK